MTRLAPIMQGFFTGHLMTHRHASPHTVASYRDTFKLVLAYAHQRTGKLPAQLDVADLVLAATLSAHSLAAFDVHVLAGLGGDAVLAGSRSGLAVVVAGEEAGERVDSFEEQRVDLGLLVSGVLGAVAGDEAVPPG